MNLHIKNIILYPKNHELTPQILTFKEDKINIITGTSQKGKSAIITIIDYCLGSGDCNIPIGLIRKTTEVFALYVNINERNYFIGRENYDSHKSKMYFYTEEDGNDRKNELRTNEWLRNKENYSINVEHFKSVMNNLSGFKNIETTLKESNFNSTAGFRDTAAFHFQTQNIIANPATMFFKTDSWEHLQKLRTIFPLLLGYKSYEIIEIENEIDIIDKERKEKSNKLQNIKDQYQNWQSDVYNYYAKAVSYGLTKSDLDIENSSVDVIKNELKSIVFSVNTGSVYEIGSAFRFSEKAIELNNQRNELTRELDNLKFKFNKINEIDSSKNNYINEVAIEKDIRLRPIEWFLERNGTNNCVFCGSENNKAVDTLLKLNHEKQKNLQILSKSKSNELSFEKEKHDLSKEIKRIENKIFDIDLNLNLLLSNKKNNTSIRDIYEFIGKIEHVIENLEKISPSSNLDLEIKKLEENIASKKQRLAILQKRFDKKHSLEKLSNTITDYLKFLPIEDNYKRKVYFDPTESLGIKIEDTIDKDKFFLSRIGSGANYMGYHLATIFGIHEFFYKLKEINKHNFIPSFLVLDQPSQVYYPKEFDDKSKDIEDTKMIFKTSYEFMKRTEFEIQLIILEHVPKKIWQGINDESFHIVEEWDNENDALIPKEWH